MIFSLKNENNAGVFFKKGDEINNERKNRLQRPVFGHKYSRPIADHTILNCEGVPNKK